MKVEKILAVTTVLLLITNGILIYQNLSMKSQLQTFELKEVRAGNILPTFAAKDLNGNAVSVAYDLGSAKRVLLYFHPTCGWCKKQMPYWKELVSSADSAKFKITAVTTDENTDETKKYLSQYDANSWEVISIKKESADNAELLSTPATVVLDNTGKVERVWIGMWREKEVADVEKYFSVNFNKVKENLSQ